jgi:hypothetical protein
VHALTGNGITVLGVVANRSRRRMPKSYSAYYGSGASARRRTVAAARDAEAPAPADETVFDDETAFDDEDGFANLVGGNGRRHDDRAGDRTGDRTGDQGGSRDDQADPDNDDELEDWPGFEQADDEPERSGRSGRRRDSAEGKKV